MARRRRSRGRGWSPFGEYVPAQERRSRGLAKARKAEKKDDPFQPVSAEGRKLAATAWGLAWCRHIESFHDFSNRLPRGRTYLRQGCVVDLRIETGAIRARVAGSELYQATIHISRCAEARWQELVERCTGKISSLVELLEGRFPAEVMDEMAGVADGLFPDLSQVKLDCSCPDWATLCKHLAAVLYGVGVRLDDQPELLFRLRDVDPGDLVKVDSLTTSDPSDDVLSGDLAAIFGVAIDEHFVPEPEPTQRPENPPRKPKTTTETTETRRSKKPAPASRLAADLVRRADLIELGVPTGTVASWLHHGVLIRTEVRGVYRQTAESRERLARRQ